MHYTRLYPGTLYLVASWILVVYVLVDFIRSLKMCKRCKPSLQKRLDKLKPVPRETSLYDILTSRQREIWLREDVVNRDRNRLSMLDIGSFCELVKAEEKSKTVTQSEHLVGWHNYDPLMDNWYCERLLYLPCWYPDRKYFALPSSQEDEMKKTSFDLVRMVMNLPYLPEERALRMEFNVDYLMEERKRLDRE